MTVKQVADRLVALCREGKNMQAVEELYSPDIVTVEPVGDQHMPAVMKGIDAVRKKGEWWFSSVEMHGGTVAGPFLGDNQFAVKFDYDVTFKKTRERKQMTEMALYTVAGDKIVREEFYYHM